MQKHVYLCMQIIVHLEKYHYLYDFMRDSKLSEWKNKASTTYFILTTTTRAVMQPAVVS